MTRRSMQLLAIPAVLVATAAVLTSVNGLDHRTGTTAVDRTRIEVGRAPLTMADGVPAPAIPAAIIGGNARWNDDEFGAWDPAADAPAAGFQDAARQAHLNTVRYPGGTVANLFDFSGAIGPNAQRTCQTSGGFAAGVFAELTPQQNRFGPDEEQRLVSRFAGQTMIMVPTINETAADAADFVEYMNSPSDGATTNPGGGIDWAEIRAANGHPAPYGIRYWEYGNEPYNSGQRYWRAVDMTQRAQQFIYGGWQRQTTDSPSYQDNDGLFSGCDLLHRKQGTGEPDQAYRTRYRPIALPGDATASSGPIEPPVLTVDGTQWTLVERLDRSGPQDTVYQVDQAGGTIRFGDGVHGAVPPTGARLSIEYTTGRQDGMLDFQRAMKAVDPDIKVCAGWAKPEFIDAMGRHPYDCLGVHSYTFPKAGDADGAFSTTQLYNNLMSASIDPTAELADLRTRLAHYFPMPTERPDLAVTEYGTINQPGPTGARMPRNFTAMLMHNVYEASLLVGQINNGVRLSINSNLNSGPATDPATRDWGQLLASPPGFAYTGRAMALSLVAPMIGGVPRRTTMTDNPEQPGQDYRALVATSTCADGVIRMLVVNRSRTDAVPVGIDSAAGTSISSARISTVTADSVTAFNTDATHFVQRITRTAEHHGRTVEAKLDPRSTNLVEFSVRGRPYC